MKSIIKASGFLLFTALIMCAFTSGYAHTKNNEKLFLPTGPRVPAIKLPTGKRSPVFRLMIPVTKSGNKTFTTVYAVIWSEFDVIYEDDYSYSEYWDYYVNFYADANATIPLYLPNDITLNLQWSEHFTGGNQNTPESDLVPQGSTQYVIGPVNTNYYDDNFYRQVGVGLAAGSGYIPLN